MTRFDARIDGVRVVAKRPNRAAAVRIIYYARVCAFECMDVTRVSSLPRGKVKCKVLL